MELKKLLEIIDIVLPEKTAMDGDRTGLQVQGGREEVFNIMVTLELNDQVVAEAVNENCDCIITFHPLIFQPLIEINDHDRVGRLCSQLIRNSIALISVHTNFDAYRYGTSSIFAEMLGLEFERFLVPDTAADNAGMGVIARSPVALNPEYLLESVYKLCNSPLRFTQGMPDKPIGRIAIVGGSGSSFMGEVLKSGCEAFISADVTYHKFHLASGRIWLIDPGHYEMEQFVPRGLMELLMKNLDKNQYNFIKLSSILTNPVGYYPGGNEYKTKQKQYLNNNRMV